jgi:SNF2 family DNA or RNA helicase
MLVSKVFIKKKPILYMQNVFFLKEALINLDKNISLVVLNQKQLKSSIDFAIETILAQKKYSIVFVSMSGPGEEILQKVNKNYFGRIVIIDAFSKDPNTYFSSIISVNNASDLTNIQIAVERAEKKIPGEKVIIFSCYSAVVDKICKSFGDKALKFTGEETEKQRENAKILFMDPDSDKDVMVMNIDAGGLGLNLQIEK